MKKLPTMTVTQFAKLCGVTPQAVSLWKSEGMPCVGTGRKGAAVRIDLASAVPWVVARRDAQPNSQRARLQAEQADRLALENAHRRGELIDAQLHGEIVKTLASTTSQLLEAVASRCANELAGITDPAAVHARLKEEHRGIRRTMASIVGEFADDLDEAADAARPRIQ
jgi:phage terminase Nu1 subunit (DNA packaging protein)